MKFQNFRPLPKLDTVNQAMNLLVIEDDAVLGKAIERGLLEKGYVCHWTRNGRRGLEFAQAQKFDAIVLDLMLPDLTGLELLKTIRAQGIRTSVIILTAMGSVEDRVNGLNAGADDYLVKPFEFAELLARLHAVSRRSHHLQSSVISVGSLTLNMSLRRVTRDGKEIELTPTEFSLLEFLLNNVGQVVTRKMLCEHLWDANWEGVTNVIEVHINRLRNKIDRDFPSPLIHTVRGKGYVLRTDVPLPS